MNYESPYKIGDIVNVRLGGGSPIIRYCAITAIKFAQGPREVQMYFDVSLRYHTVKYADESQQPPAIKLYDLPIWCVESLEYSEIKSSENEQ